MPIWLIILMILGILVGFGLAIYATSLVPPLSYILMAIAIIIMATTILGPLIAEIGEKTEAAEALKSSGGESAPQISIVPTATETREGNSSAACYWVWTNTAHDPTDRFGNRLLANEPVVECLQPGWGISGENIPPYCWCGGN